MTLILSFVSKLLSSVVLSTVFVWMTTRNSEIWTELPGNYNHIYIYICSWFLPFILFRLASLFCYREDGMTGGAGCTRTPQHVVSDEDGCVSPHLRWIQQRSNKPSRFLFLSLHLALRTMRCRCRLHMWVCKCTCLCVCVCMSVLQSGTILWVSSVLAPMAA